MIPWDSSFPLPSCCANETCRLYTIYALYVVFVDRLGCSLSYLLFLPEAEGVPKRDT